jgi:hypothetical protein
MTTCTPKNGSGLKVLTITVENLAPPMGTVVTPLWFGFHDGSFTIYRDGAPASAALERLAEDANAGRSATGSIRRVWAFPKGSCLAPTIF